MKPLFLCAIVGALALPAFCQPRQNQNQNQNNAFGQNGGAIFQLPPSVKDVVSVDAQNMVIIVSEKDGETRYTPTIIKHVYSGGIARLFGGTIIPTAQFVTPGVMSNAQNGQGNGQNNGNQNNFGNNGFGNNNGQNNGTVGFGILQSGVFGGGRAANNGPINAQMRPRN